jgi:hypothetical protein
VSSNEPDGGSREVYGGKEVASGFVVAGSDGAEEFEFGEEVFNQMARLVEVLVIFALDLAVGLGRNHRDLTRCLERNQNPLIGIEAFVGEYDVGLELRQQNIGSIQIASLPGRKMKPGRVAQGIDRGMNLGAQPAFTASDGLVRAPFLRAPALC